MPIVIQEIVIRAVVETGSKRPRRDEEARIREKEELLQDCVAETLRIIREKEER